MTIACQTVNIYNLAINSTPTGARIWIGPAGGTLVDQGVDTNSAFIKADGSYDIRLVKSGYQDYTQTVTASSTALTTVNAVLTPATGSVTISSTPTGATIYLDGSGTPSGTTGPTTISGLSPGSHTYELTLTGYANATGSFTITSGVDTPLAVTFAGSANITSTPTGARVWLAISPGIPVDQGPGKDTNIIFTGMTDAVAGATRDWNYKLTKVGYADATGTSTATAGTTVNVPITWSAANITATNVDVVPSQTPCIAGTCTVTVDVIWTNQGGSPGAFTPNISVDGTPLSPAPYPSENLNSGASVTHTFPLVGLTAATHTICPIPN